eukprot:669655-Alexandrium_andersonii.AAC.1
MHRPLWRARGRLHRARGRRARDLAGHGRLGSGRRLLAASRGPATSCAAPSAAATSGPRWTSRSRSTWAGAGRHVSPAGGAAAPPWPPPF